MKNGFILISIILLTVFVFSCKKENSNNPPVNITYTHWYKMKSNAPDTLFTVYIPNAFTPNGDGMNDYFKPYVYDTLYIPISYNLKVFDKNNKMVFQTNDLYEKWNGRLNNVKEPMPIGVYTYKFTLTPANTNTQYDYTGGVMLID